MLRLTSITDAYGELVRQAFRPNFANIAWAQTPYGDAKVDLPITNPDWQWSFPLRLDSARRQALLEIDALVALSLNLSADELCTIYRTQFPVLFGYDRKVSYYDTEGRLVPKQVLADWRLKGDHMTKDERTATNASGNAYTYELPFVTLDREADMRQAYAHFQRLLQERS
jgi:hypothetical protein